jgi:hypothetical protein
MIDDSIQRAIVEQQKAQALLEELKAQPRKENLEIAMDQIELARANLITSQDQLDKQRISYELDPKSVSKDALDNTMNVVKVAKGSLGFAQKQYELTKAGAWIYDIRNQLRVVPDLLEAFHSSFPICQCPSCLLFRARNLKGVSWRLPFTNCSLAKLNEKRLPGLHPYRRDEGRAMNSLFDLLDRRTSKDGRKEDKSNPLEKKDRRFHCRSCHHCDRCGGDLFLSSV